MTPVGDVVHVEVSHAAARLAAPAVTRQNFVTQLRVILSIKLCSLSFGQRSAHDAFCSI